MMKQKREEDEEYQGDEDNEEPEKRKRGRRVRAQRKSLGYHEERKSAIKPKWCHQCKAKKRDVIQCCGEGKTRGANNQVFVFGIRLSHAVVFVLIVRNV